MRRAAMLQMQRDCGNASVQRYLRTQPAGRAPLVQRDPTAGGGAQGAQGGKQDAPADTGKPKDWLHSQIYDLIKAQLGEDKLKEYGDKLADKAAGALLDQVKGATSQADFVQKAQLKLVGDQLNADIKKGVEDLLKSEEGKKLRDLIAGGVKADPGVAVGTVLAAVALAVAANAPAKLDLDGKIGKSGFSWAAKADMGTLRDLSLQYVQASLKYSSESFKAALSASYSGEKGALAEAKLEMGGAGAKSEASGSATIDPKTNQVKAEVGTVLSNSQLSMATKLQFDKGVGGVFALKLGGEEKNLATQVKLGSDGKVSLQFDQKLSMNVVNLSTSLAVGDETKMSHKIDVLQPFGVKDLTISANVAYTVVDPTITAGGLAVQYKLVDKGDSPIPLLVIGVSGDYKAREGDKPSTLQGLAVIQGRF